MIIKVANYSSFQSVSAFEEYNEEGEEQGEEKETTLLHSTISDKAERDEVFNYFKEAHGEGKSKENPFLHYIISLSPEDGKKPEGFHKKLIEDFIASAGLQGLPYMAYQHHDRPHDHVHIFIPRPLEKNDRKYKSYYYLKHLARDFEQQHDLNPTPNTWSEAIAQKYQDKPLPEGWKGTKKHFTDIVSGKIEGREDFAMDVIDALEQLIVSGREITSYSKLNEYLKAYDIKAYINKYNKVTFYNVHPVTKKKIKTNEHARSVSLEALGWDNSKIDQLIQNTVKDKAQRKQKDRRKGRNKD